ncbi:hypothetical protein BDF14DRAFT_1941766 [Spinellus fusiger]|nr:hypothetical protein BDF14DRAFT_1941766 [Spinellus fusiger]
MSPTASFASADTLTLDTRNKYIGLFQSSRPVNGVLSGDIVKNILMRSQLPPDTLHAIWNLANTRKSDTLNQTEFIIAMHYVSMLLSQSIPSLPATLPAAIYTAAAGGFAPTRQFFTNSPVMRSMTTGSPVFSNESLVGRGSEVSPEEIAKYNVFFDNLDTQGTGYVSGADAVHFFRHSKLPEPELAQIWDFADTESKGQLNKQQFSIAMHCINRRMTGGQLPIRSGGFNRGKAGTICRLVIMRFATDMATPATSHPTSTIEPSGLTRPLETELLSIKNEIRIEKDRADTLHLQHTSETQAVHELQEQVRREKEILESLKQKNKEAKQLLDQEKAKKNTLTKELSLLSQESAHHQQRSEQLEKERMDLVANQEVRNNFKNPSTDHSVFALSNVPSSELFATVDKSTVQSPSSVHSVPLSMSNHTKPINILDPFSSMKKNASASSSPVMSLKRIKQENEARQQQTVSPNVDISEIEAKFPDLHTMEEKFSMPVSDSSVSMETSLATPASTLPTHTTPLPTTPVTTATPFLNNAFHFTTSPAPPTALSPTQNKSVAKYGFDLSAFETPSTTSASSVKDELSLLFGAPQTEYVKKESTTQFDDIFHVSTPQPPTESKKSFESIFFS